jgi:site-specific recombinase XerD
MAGEIIVRAPSELVLQPGFDPIPSTIARAGEKAAYRFFEFFTANIRNQNTRRAYFRNAAQFFDWASARGLRLEKILSVHVAAYIEELGQSLAKPTVKQHLAAIRMLFDWLVVGQIVAANPAASVRGPKHVVKQGRTPILTEDEARHLLDSIDTSHVVGLRDRALIGVLIYTFARIDAALSMNVEDYFPQGKRWWIRLSEKNDKVLELPAHHKLEAILDEYIQGAKLDGQKKQPLFRTARGQRRELTARRMTQADAWRMIRRRAADAGIKTTSKTMARWRTPRRWPVTSLSEQPGCTTAATTS